MYKSKLQELCQRKSWSLPNYLTEKIGLSHIPGFKATVIVNGVSFNTPDLHKHLKEAHNEAARLALSHYTADTPISNIPPAAKPIAAAESSSVIPPSSSSGAITGNTIQSNVLKAEEVAQPNEKLQTSLIDGNSSGSNGSTLVELKHTYKNQLQIYAQKRSLAIPVYSCEQEGPPHASRFRCKVTVSEQTYESPDFFSTLKEAEYAAAKVALMSLQPHGETEDNFIFYKNLLQELAQREGLRLPKYSSNVSGESHMPTFVSTVEVEGEIFQGEEAKTKKQAELNAAKVAYIALRERRMSQSRPQFHSANCQLQEATSSSLQSEIIVDLLKKSLHKAPHANVFPKEDVEPGIAVDQEASNKVLVEYEVSTLQVPAPCINPGTDTRRKRAVPDIVYARQKDPSPSIPFMPEDEDGPSSSHCTPEFISEVATDLIFEHPAGVNTLKCKKVCVFSRKLDAKLPDGVIVYSDDKWIALESGPDGTV